MVDERDRQHILTVNSNPRNLELLNEFLGRAGYEVSGVSALDAFDRFLSDHPPIDLALVDVSGFGPQIWMRCQTLQQQGIPFLVISPRQSAALQQESLTYGARGVLVKPLVVKDLLGVIKGLLSAGV